MRPAHPNDYKKSTGHYIEAQVSVHTMNFIHCEVHGVKFAVDDWSVSFCCSVWLDWKVYKRCVAVALQLLGRLSRHRQCRTSKRPIRICELKANFKSIPSRKELYDITSISPQTLYDRDLICRHLCTLSNFLDWIFCYLSQSNRSNGVLRIFNRKFYTAIGRRNSPSNMFKLQLFASSQINLQFANFETWPISGVSWKIDLWFLAQKRRSFTKTVRG